MTVKLRQFQEVAEKNRTIKTPFQIRRIAFYLRKILFLWPLKETQNMPIELVEKYQLNNQSLEKLKPLHVIQNKCSLIPTSPHDTDFFLTKLYFHWSFFTTVQ